MDVYTIFRLTFLGILLCFNEVECGRSGGCYTNYQQCYKTFSQVERPEPFTADWPNFCNAVDTFDNCLKNDVTTCESNVTIPQEYTKYVSYAADSKESCKVDYCPKMSECFKHGTFSNPIAVCGNVGSFITCIEEKCANKPQIGQQSLTKIREVFTGICGVISQYLKVALCTDFTSCIEKAPSLPGTVVNSLQSFASARDTDRWCRIAKSYVGCGETAANSCSLGSTFTTAVSTVKTSTDQACTGVRGPCIPVSKCLATLQENNLGLRFKTTCPNIPAFVTCTDNALTTCGEESRVKADYSLGDVKNLYVETCNAMTDDLYQCNLMSSCLNLQLPSYIGDMMDEFSDQTSWCRKLNRMLKCTADVSTSCRQPKAVHDKFMMLYHKVNKHCPSPTLEDEKETDKNRAVKNRAVKKGADAFRVTGVLVMTVFLMIFI